MTRLVLNSLFVFALIASTFAQQTTPPYCISMYNQSQPNIIVNFQETFMLPLQEVFFGNNLYFTINATIPGVQLVQALTQLGQSNPTVQTGASIVALANYQNANGQIQYSLLEQIPNQINYTVRFFQAANQQSVPDFSQISTLLYNDNMTFCTDLVYITNETIAVDCYRNEPSNGVIQTFYYLTSLQNHGQTIYPSQGNYIPYPFFSRKSISYQVDGGFYMLSYVPYGQFMVNNSEYYIDVYRYNYNNTMNDYPLGFLDTQVPITAQDLKTVDLQIVQVLAFGNTVVVLDLVQGLFSFQYISNQLHNLVNIPLIQIQKAWGMTLGNAAGLQVLIVVGESYVYEYAWYDFAYVPYLMGQYPLSHFPLTAPVSVTFNVDYIVVQYSTGEVDIYSRNDYFVYQQFTGQFFQLLNTDNILVYSNNEVTNFQISDPLVVMSGSEQTVDNNTQAILVSATSLGSNGARLSCNQIFNFTFYQDPNDLNIYPTGLTQTNTLNQINDINSYMMVGNYYIGANLSYNITNISQGINADLFIPKQSTIYFLLNNAIFTQTFNINITNNYVIQQDNNSNIFVFNCFAPQNQSYLPSCSKVYNLSNIGYNISIFLTGYYNQNPFWLSVNTTSNNNSVIGYSFINGIILFQINIGYPILDVEVSNELLYVLYKQSNIPIISMYSFFSQLQPYGYITPNTIQSFPNAQQYNPIQLQASLTDPGTFFAMSASQIMVMQIINGKPLYLYNIQLNLPTTITTQRMILSFDSLVVLYDGPQGGIMEYSIFDYTYLKFQKNYPLYGMSITTPLTYSYSLFNQLIYVQVQNQTTSNSSIFVYHPGSLNLNVLYTSFQLQNIQTNLNFLQAGGKGADYMFASLNGQLQFFWVPIEQYILLKTNFVNTNYVNMGNINITAYNNASSQNLETVQLSFLNSQTQLFVNQTTFNAATNNGFLALNKSLIITPTYNISFSDFGWFTGSVVYYQLQCQQTIFFPCSEQFTLTNNFNLQYGQINSNFIQNPIDYYLDQLNTQLLYVLTNNYIYPLNSSTLQIAGKPIFLNNHNSQCLKMVPLTQNYILYNLTILLTVCYNKIEQQYYVLPISFTNPEPTPSVPLFLPQINQIGQVEAMDGYLLVQDYGRPQNQVLGSVYVYQINFANPKTPVIVMQLGSATLGQASVDITSFTLSATENPNFRVIFLTSKTFSLYAVTVQSSNYASYYVQMMNAQDIIQSNSMVLPNNEVLNQVVFLNSSSNNIENTYSYSVLLVTQGSSLFEFELVFNQSTLINQRQWFWTYLQRTYSGYGWSYPIPDIQVIQTLNFNGFVVGYYINNLVTLVYFNRTYTSSQFQVVPITSGYEVFSNNMAFTFQLYTNSSDELLTILCADPLGGIQQVTYSPKLTLSINMATLATQYLTFIPFNQFSTNNAQASILLEQLINPVTPSNSSSYEGDNLWWIAIIIIGGLILCGLALYFIRKKKMNELEEEAQVSLQQQNYETK